MRRTRAALLATLAALLLPRAALADVWTLHSAGTLVAAFDGDWTPSAPTITAGDTLILWTFAWGNGSPYSLSTPAGWTLLYDAVTADPYANGKVFCRVATGGDSMPTINWGSSGYAFVGIQVVSFSGPTAPDCSTMLDGGAVFNEWSGVWPTPALAVTTDNDLILEFGTKSQDYDPVEFSPILCPASVNQAQIAVYTEIEAYYPQVAACYEVQTTATSIGPEYFTPNSDHGYVVFSAIVALKQQDISLPSWTVEPVVTKVDNNTIRATFTGESVPANTTKCAVYPKGTSKPSAADVAAGTGAHGTGSATTTGSSQYIDIDVTDPVPFPAYREYCVQDAGEGNYSDVPNASDVCLDPPSGMQYVACPSGLAAVTTSGSVPKLYNDAAWTNVPYDTLSSAFTVNKALIDRTSGAWGFIRANQGGNNLIVDVYDGTFANNDEIVDSAGGAALVNGSTSALSPRAALGDILVEPVAVSPAGDGQGCPGSANPACLVFDVEGSFSYSAAGRQRFVNGLVYHAATAEYLPIDADMVVNNHAPAGTPSLASAVMPLGQIYSLNLNSVFSDADGDSIQFAWLSGALPPFTLNDATGIFSGNPDTEHETGVDLRFLAYDSWGDVAIQNLKAVPVDTWTLSANCLGQEFSTCDAAIRTQTFNSVSVVQSAAACSASAIAVVLTQNPPAGTEVAPGSTVVTTTSAGHARLCAAALREQGE